MVFKSVGIAIEDIAAAKLVYERVTGLKEQAERVNIDKTVMLRNIRSSLGEVPGNMTLKLHSRLGDFCLSWVNWYERMRLANCIGDSHSRS